MTPVGRNDPCPCGGGRKFKKCCLASSQGSTQERETSPEMKAKHLATPMARSGDERMLARLAGPRPAGGRS
jgi:hypothetical protein